MKTATPKLVPPLKPVRGVFRNRRTRIGRVKARIIEGSAIKRTRLADGVEVAACTDSMTKQRREGEADGPQGQRPARVSRGGPSWTEFVRLAAQAVVAIAGAGMINRAEPRACGYSRGPRRLDSEPETERNVGPASNEAGNGFGRVQDDQAGFQPDGICGQGKNVA